MTLQEMVEAEPMTSCMTPGMVQAPLQPAMCGYRKLPEPSAATTPSRVPSAQPAPTLQPGDGTAVQSVKGVKQLFAAADFSTAKVQSHPSQSPRAPQVVMAASAPDS